MFIDINSNSIKDANEPIISNQKIVESDTSKFTFSNSIGNYNFVFPDSGSYTVFPEALNYYNVVPVYRNINFSGVNMVDSLNDFAYQPGGVYNDLKVEVSPVSFFVSGFNSTCMISYQNIGTSVLDGIVTLTLDSNTNYVSSNLTPSFISTDSIKWDVGTLAQFESGNIAVTIHIDSLLTDSTLIIPYVRIDPHMGDANMSNNFANWEVPTVSSLDPNMILVNREKLFNTELFTAPYLDYIIFFQNTGTAACVNVKVQNNLPAFLNENSFEFIASSHPVTINYGAYARLMTYSFDNINLPDSGANETASHGFIRYRIKPISTLIAGDSIKNSAAIYFDFNPPVITEYALTEITLPTSITSKQVFSNQLEIFPNPTNGIITIYTSALINEYCQLSIYDLFGRTVLQSTLISSKFQVQTDVSTFSKGVYFVELKQNDKVIRGKFLKE